MKIFWHLKLCRSLRFYQKTLSVYFFMDNKLFFFFHHTTCETTCDTLTSSAANQGDNTVSVAQCGTASTLSVYFFMDNKLYIHIYIEREKEGQRQRQREKKRGVARGVMLIIVRNGRSDQSSNPRRGYLH